VSPDEKCLFLSSRQHSHPGSVECLFRNSNKLLICGSCSFGLAEYFSFSEYFTRFAWHTEVVMAPASCKLEPDLTVKRWKRTILKAPSLTARWAKMTHWHVERGTPKHGGTGRSWAWRVQEGCTWRGTRGGVHQLGSRLGKVRFRQKSQIPARNVRSRPGISDRGQEYQYSARNISTRTRISVLGQVYLRPGLRPVLGLF